MPGSLASLARRSGLALWSAAYHLAEAELAFAARLPARLRRLSPDWPVGATLAVDVGASVGVYSRAFARWAPHTLAVEPNAALAAHLRALDLPGLEVVEAAAGAEAGMAQLTDPSPSGWRRPTARLGEGGGWQQPCRVERLDRLVPGDTRALVVKIDAEGVELEVLRGMGRLLDLRHILVLVEIEHRPGADPQALFALLEKAGLTACQLTSGTLVPATPAMVPTPPEGGAGRFPRLTGYRNNFIFTRRPSG